MKRLLVVVLVICMMFATASPVLAAKPDNQQTLQWNVHWGQPDSSGQAWTHWSASAVPAMEVISYTSFRTSGGSSLQETLKPEGRSATFSGGYHMSAPDQFFLQTPGSDHAFAGMGWNVGVCEQGPQVNFNIMPDQRVTIINTTGNSLWLIKEGDGESSKELKPGESIERKAGGPQGQFLLQTTNTSESWNTCATIMWWLDK